MGVPFIVTTSATEVDTHKSTRMLGVQLCIQLGTDALPECLAERTGSLGKRTWRHWKTISCPAASTWGSACLLAGNRRRSRERNWKRWHLRTGKGTAWVSGNQNQPVTWSDTHISFGDFTMSCYDALGFRFATTCVSSAARGCSWSAWFKIRVPNGPKWTHKIGHDYVLLRYSQIFSAFFRSCMV